MNLFFQLLKHRLKIKQAWQNLSGGLSSYLLIVNAYFIMAITFIQKYLLVQPE